MRVILLFFISACLLLADNYRLYLTDGTFHTVSKHEVLADRIRYYSVERSDWEELPLDLVDLKKTDAERKVRVEQEKKSAALEDAEEKFERDRRREIARIPVDPGLFYLDGDKAAEIKLAELKSLTDKKRSILKAMSPIPIVPGKSSLEITGDQAPTVFSTPTPDLYFRINSAERFTIVKLRPKKGARQVAILQIEPVTKMGELEMTKLDVFRQQLQDDLYKVWPTKPLEPGEYALVQYSEGEVQIQCWDFRIAPAKQ